MKANSNNNVKVYEKNQEMQDQGKHSINKQRNVGSANYGDYNEQFTFKNKKNNQNCRPETYKMDEEYS